MVAHSPIRIGLTQGDPYGVGPELCALALQEFASRADIQLTLFGAAQRVLPDRTLTPHDAGVQSASYVETAVAAIRERSIDAIVTAPIHKGRWHLAGVDAPGHTEYLAQLWNFRAPPATRMLFWSDDLRIACVTTHIPLAEVARAITAEQLESCIRTTHTFLQRVGISAPRLACLGVNPHAGEAGLLGEEEERVVIPTLEKLRRDGITIDGPYPADGYFRTFATNPNMPPPLPSPASGGGPGRGPHDCVIAMYHDQGLIPVKLLAPHTAVNVTMGLPFIRVSPGHGTAEDIAGTGRVDPRNFFAAIETAAHLARHFHNT